MVWKDCFIYKNFKIIIENMYVYITSMFFVHNNNLLTISYLFTAEVNVSVLAIYKFCLFYLKNILVSSVRKK